MKRIITAAILSIGLAFGSVAIAPSIASAATPTHVTVFVHHDSPPSVTRLITEHKAELTSAHIYENARVSYRLAAKLVHGASIIPRAEKILQQRAAARRAAAARAAALAAQVQAPIATVSIGNYSGFQACVISRESGGNAQIMNSTGHYGLYQFSYSTWIAYGGSPSTFGHASVAEQNQVFANAMATPGGASNWAPYDGC